MIHVGKNIDKILKEKGVKKTEFADLIGKTREHTYKILANKNINSEILQKLHDTYGIEYNLFFNDDKSNNVSIEGDNNVIKDVTVNGENKGKELNTIIDNLQKEILLLREIIDTKDMLIENIKKNI